MSTVTIAGTGGDTVLPIAVSIDGSTDYLPIYTASSQATQAINRNTLLGLTSAPVGLSDIQSMTNKTLGNTNTVTLKDTMFTLQDDGDTTKQARFQLSGITTATTRTYTLPDTSDTLVTLAATQTLTNKTLTSPTIASPTITNATITADTISGYTVANTGTVYGLSITSGQIPTAGIADNAVTTAKINAGAVTASKRSQVVTVGTVTPSTTGNVSVTGVGFTPKVVKFVIMSTASTSFCSGGNGAMTSSTQYTTTWNTDATNAARYSSSSNCISLVSASSSTPAQLASYVSMDSDGFTINFSAQNGTQVAWEAWG